jgi:predicted dehydrogenase
MVGSGIVDAVTVSTPLETHVPLVLEAIDLGIPVVADKPFAVDAATARTVVRAAESAGVLLSIYQNRRWDADMLTTRKVIESGALGDIVTFQSNMEEYPPGPEFSTETGGGVLLDFGAHVIDQALSLFGGVKSVFAEMRVVPGKGGFDDRFFALLRHSNGVSSHVIANWQLQGAPSPRFRVLGTKGTFAIEGDDGLSRRILAGETAASAGRTWGRVDEGKWGAIYRAGVAEVVPTEKGAWSDFYSGWARAVRGEGLPPVDPWDTVAALEVLDAARTSALTGEVVRLG